MLNNYLVITVISYDIKGIYEYYIIITVML